MSRKNVETSTNWRHPYRWVWADSAARSAQSVDSGDLYKRGLQIDTLTEYFLTDDSPVVWTAAGGSGGGSGADGNDGWSPILAVVSDGTRRVLQVSDWTGGEGTKPTTGQYVGASGLVTLVADAVDVRGATGTTGATGATGATGPTGATGATGATGPAAWSAVAAWAGSTAYVVGPPSSVVTYLGETYVCTTAHTSTGSFDATKWSKVAARGSGTRQITFDLYMSDGSVLTTGLWATEIRIPFGLTPAAWYVRLPNESGSIVADVRKGSGTYPAFSTSVAGTEKPTVSSAREASDTNLTTWTALVAGDVLRVNVDSVSLATRAIIDIICTES